MHAIRNANIADAKRLSILADKTFRDTFEAFNTAEDMKLHCESHYSETIQANEILNSEIVTLVCESGDELIGYVQLRWNNAPTCVGGIHTTEIQRLYVDKLWHGKGIAQDLMARSLAFAEGRGSDKLWLGVWERNPRAIAFYKKFAFVEVGAHVFPLGSDPQRDIILVRDLNTAITRA